MNSSEHKQYLKDFKEYSKKVISSKDESKKFFVKAGIHTEKGNLKRIYTEVRHQSNR